MSSVSPQGGYDSSKVSPEPTADALPTERPQGGMDLSFDGDAVHAGPDARERFYDSRGYGRTTGGDLTLAPVETAHLLYRGDVDTVYDERDGSRLDFRGLLGSAAVSEVDFFVYKDLRDRGFYLSPAADDQADFTVYPRGDGPWDDTTAYRVRAVGERTDLAADSLRRLVASTAAGEAVLAIVDEESEVTYLGVDERAVSGSTDHEIPPVTGELLADRVVVWEPPAELHGKGFYGQRLDQAGDPVQLSLVEAAYLAGEGGLETDSGDGAITERGRAVEGERFDRRRRVYAALRTAGVVPKTGFKFGADFRTYGNVESVDELGHSELLVRVLPGSHTFEPRDLALDVRLAHGVRKTMVFALVGNGIEWLSVTRRTP